MDEKKKLIAKFEKIDWGGPDPAHVVQLCISYKNSVTKFLRTGEQNSKVV